MNEWQMEYAATAARDHAETMEFLSANLRKDLIDQTIHDHADSQQEIMAMLQQALTTGKTEPTQQEGLREVCRPTLSHAHANGTYTSTQNLYHASNHFGELELLPVLRLQQGGEVVRVGQVCRMPVVNASVCKWHHSKPTLARSFPKLGKGAYLPILSSPPSPTGRMSCILTWHAAANTWATSG
jgi:hypothetical protein